MNLYESLLEKTNGHRYGEYFMMSCLWHGSDSHPSMMVFETGYKCLTCGAKGSLEKLNKHLGGKSVVTKSHSNTVLPKWKRWEENFGDITGIAKHAHLSLKLLS